MRLLVAFALLAVCPSFACALEPAAPPVRGHSHVTRVWLSQASPDARRVTISWESTTNEDSQIEVAAAADGAGALRIARDEKVRHHAIEIVPPVEHGPWFYRVGGTGTFTPWIKARGVDADEFRAVVVADLGYAKQPWAEAVLREDPHLVLTAGDNVPQLHAAGNPADKGDVRAFQKLIDLAPRLFESVPFLPVLGNHDREIRPRGPKPPTEPVYDIAATAFRRFFALPGNETFWHHDVPAFGVRFVALDLNHVQDFGTTWQTCSPFAVDSEQLAWYRATMEKSREPYLITIYNEKHSVVRGLAGGAWKPHLEQSSAVVTGFGYFAERFTWEGKPFFNTSVSGRGGKYPDPKSEVLKSEDNLLVLTFRQDGPAVGRLKSLAGAMLDEVPIAPRRLADGATAPRVVTQPLVLRQGGEPDRPAVFDGGGMTIDLGIDVTAHPWIVEGDLWRSGRPLLGRKPIAAGQIAGLFIDETPITIPRDVAAERLHPEKKSYCYVAPEKLQPGQMGYADDGTLYFRFPTGKDPKQLKIIAPPAPGTSGVSIACSHITVRNVHVKYAANDGFNLHGGYQGIRLENVTAFSCADEGISAHGTIQMDVDGAEVAFNGSAAGGVADVDQSVTTYRRMKVHDNAGAGFYFSGKRHKVTESQIYNQKNDFSVKPRTQVERD